MSYTGLRFVNLRADQVRVLSKAEQLSLFGSGTQTAKVKGHTRVTKGGKAVAVKQHTRKTERVKVRVKVKTSKKPNVAELLTLSDADAAAAVKNSTHTPRELVDLFTVGGDMTLDAIEQKAIDAHGVEFYDMRANLGVSMVELQTVKRTLNNAAVHLPVAADAEVVARLTENVDAPFAIRQGRDQLQQNSVFGRTQDGYCAVQYQSRIRGNTAWLCWSADGEPELRVGADVVAL